MYKTVDFFTFMLSKLTEHNLVLSHFLLGWGMKFSGPVRIIVTLLKLPHGIRGLLAI